MLLKFVENHRSLAIALLEMLDTSTLGDLEFMGLVFPIKFTGN